MIDAGIEQTIKGYELRAPLGEGGYGLVFRAWQPQVGRDVAIKIILPQHANRPEFIRRFESEAQLVARLEHPYIVPLYDYWRDPSGAFLVMRFLRGGSLHDALHQQPLPIEQLLRLLDQVGGALAAAHRRGVIHRDLKPANILLDDDGNAYLADFGIAKDLGKQLSPYQTDQTSVVGAPAYISPEQVRAAAITPQTDIYSFGVMLYEILTGQLPFQAPTPIALMFKHVHDPMPPLALHRPDLPPAVTAVIHTATAKNPADRYPDVPTLIAELKRALGAAATTTAWPAGAHGATPSPTPRRTSYETALLQIPAPLVPPTPLDNPYKGLRAFQEADAAEFFGRETLVERLLERLRETGEYARFLAVVGPSGSGKSSVVRAGLVPALKRGALPGSERWFVLECFPGAQPLQQLAQALLRIAVNPPGDLLEPLALDAQGLLRVVDQVVPGGDETEVVLVLDQFEELFTLVEDEGVRAHVLGLLLRTVSDPYSRVRVVVTLRADFYDRPLRYAGFSGLMRERTEVVVPLAEEELRAAIVGPAERVGVRVEGELVEAIVSDVGEQPGALPLLQYALTEVFARRNGRTLTLEGYAASGGVVGALGRRAEEIYGGLSAAGQEAARQVFLRLVTLGEGVEDTRRRVRRSELAGTGGEAKVLEEVLEAYSGYRLLTGDHDPETRAPTVEVAHEALLRTWGRLRGWLEASREDVRVQRRLGAAAGEWAGSGKERSFLARGARLEQLAGWAGETHLGLNEEEREYLAASVAAREEERAGEEERALREARLEARSRGFLRGLVGVAGAAAVLGVVLAVYAFGQRGLAEANAARADAKAQEAQANADTAATAQAIAETAAASERQQKQSAEQSAAEARNLALAAEAQAALNKGDTDLALSLALAANSNDTRVRQSEVVLSEAAYDRGTRQVFRGHKAGVQAVALSPDERTFLSGSDDKTLILWDRATGKPIRTFSGHTGKLLSVAFSPDGKLALSSADDKRVILWDVATGAALRDLAGHQDLVNEGAFSPDGKTAATASKDTTLMLWDVATGQPIRTFSGHTQSVQSVAFSSDGSQLLSASLDTSVRLWDTNTAALIREFDGHRRSVWDANFSPDGKKIVSGSEDRSIILWDKDSGKILFQLRGHTNDVWKTKFASDGRTVISASRDTRLGLWNADTGDLVGFLSGHGSSVRDVTATADGKQLLSASIDSSVRLWDLATGAEVGRFNGHSDGINRLVIGRDGKTAITASTDGRLMLWKVDTGEIIRTFTGHNGAVFGADVSPDGTLLVSGGQDKTAILWNVADGTVRHVFQGHTDGISSVAFSPDGKTVLTSSVDKTIRQWDVATGKQVREFDGHKDQVFHVVFSPDGKTFLSASGDKQVILWDIASGKQRSTFAGHTAVVRQVVFSADGTTALSSGDDKLVLLWDVASGKILKRMLGHTAAVRAVAFSPDGKTAISGSSDTDVILWDLETGSAIRRFSGHSGVVRTVAWSPDGRTAYSGATDASVRFWRIDSFAELLSWAKANRYHPDLTCDQAAYYRLNIAGCGSAQ